MRFKKLVNLTSAHISGYKCAHINDEAISNLSKLKSLELGPQTSITNLGLKKLTSLQHLNLKENTKITNEGIMKLVNLTSLDLTRNQMITSEGLKGLTNLTSLNLTENIMIGEEVKHLNLPNLKEIVFSPYIVLALV